MDSSLPGCSVHGDSPGKNTGVGCHALLQGIFPAQESNPGSPALQADSLPIKLWGRPAHPIGCFKWKGNPVISCPLALGRLCFSGLSLWSPSSYSDLCTSSSFSKGCTHTSVFFTIKINFAEAFVRSKRIFLLHMWFFSTFHYLFFSLLKSISWAATDKTRARMLINPLST